MNLHIKKTNSLYGACTLPGSKSHTIRSLLLGALCNGVSNIANALDSEDTRTCMKVCSAIGAPLTVLKGDGDNLLIAIEGRGIPLQIQSSFIETGNSGITTRFLLPLLGLARSMKTLRVSCGTQMQKRPILPFIDALTMLGMDIRAHSKRTVWPLRVQGTLQGGKAVVDGTTSQYISALLLALPCAQNDSLVTVKNLNERPYVEMTTRYLNDQNIHYSWTKDGQGDHFSIKGGYQYKPFQKKIPADFSSASYPIAAAVLCEGKVTIKNLALDDAQGDKRILAILSSMGAKIKIKKSEVVVHGVNPLKGIRIDCNDIPDMVPTLAVIGTQAQGKTILYNARHARLKETDRISSMAQELRNMGADIEETNDGLVIKKSVLVGRCVKGHGDHRTIMALAVAGLVAQGKTTIEGAEGVSKTFPKFVKILKSLGANMQQA